MSARRNLSDHTSLKIGGPVFRWLEPETLDDILQAISIAEKAKKGLAVIGKGTNILAHDKGFDGVLVKLGKGFDYIEKEEDGAVRVGAATPISRLVKKCAEWGLGGCEFLAGIPGSFGGALFMNAGVRDACDAEKYREIKDIVLDVDVWDLRDIKRRTLSRADIDFSYRSSGLDGKCIISARIMLQKAQESAIIKGMDSYMKKRQWMQKLKSPSAGSVFKNPDSANSAGMLIEKCDLKGRRIGGAEISALHANFIANTGNASSKDVLDLIELAKKTVKQKFNIDLELELKLL